jgi:hypothetical protein
MVAIEAFGYLPGLAEHTVTVAGLAATIGVVLRYSPRAAYAVLWLVAGVIVIFGRDEQSRVERALGVLKELRASAAATEAHEANPRSPVP